MSGTCPENLVEHFNGYVKSMYATKRTAVWLPKTVQEQVLHAFY